MLRELNGRRRNRPGAIIMTKGIVAGVLVDKIRSIATEYHWQIDRRR